MSVQLGIFGVYFLVIAVIGWYSLRQTSTESDYWIAGGQLGWLLGGATIAATNTSAGTFIGTIGVVHEVGWSFAWVALSLPLAYWFTAAVLAPRFTRVRELTLPAFLEARYDSKGVRALGAVIILVATVVYVQAQIVAGGLIANIAFGVPTRWGMVGFTAILLAYTIVGGMVAVVYTDFAQLVIMVLGAAIALPLAARQLDGFGGMLEYAAAANPTAFTWEGLPPSLLFTMGLAFMLGAVSTPDRLIRLYAMKDMPTIRRGILLAIVVATGLNLLVFVL
ncbi:MAG TPA: hypothetical protein VLL48_05970, partial [Longimicrobiales bacterium]|nr:hypothetical protein [Longimicrobiales bacterium]